MSSDPILSMDKEDTVKPPIPFVASTYAISVASILFFTILALVFARKHNKKNVLDTEAFLTARGTQSWSRIGWSFFAGSMGAWVVTVPSGCAAEMGIFGVIAYALANGLPSILVAFLGKYIHLQLPKPLSLSDFTYWRFGRSVHILVISLCLFNMCLALVSEYTVLCSLFQQYLGTVSWPMTFLMGICTLGYSAYGGLATSILTDQFQGICAFLFTFALAAYLGAVFRPTLPPFPAQLSNPSGIWSFFTLILSISSAVLYSESFWQRVWASKTLKDTKKASFLSFAFTFLVIFFFGFCGVLAFWAYGPAPEKDQNLIVFTLLPDRYSWVGAFLVLFTTIMNQGCIDSLQNGLAATLAATFCKDRTLWVTRLILILVNVPCLVLGHLQLEAFKVFLFSNLVTSCAFLPLVLSLLDINQTYIHSSEFILSFLFGILALLICGLVKKDGDFVEAMKWTWWTNSYDSYLFLSLLGGSVFGILLSLIIRRIGK